jgi:hypothetical protein
MTEKINMTQSSGPNSTNQQVSGDINMYNNVSVYITYVDNKPESIISPEIAITPKITENKSYFELGNQIKELRIARMQDFLIRHNYFKRILSKDEHTLEILKEFEGKKGVLKAIPYLDDFYKRLSIEGGLIWWLSLPQLEKKKQFDLLVEQVKSNYGEKYVDKD